MLKKSKIIGLGLILVDAKTKVKDCIPLPNGKRLLSLLDTHPSFVYSFGGVVPNILTAYSHFTGSSASLLGCVGNDKRGQDYQRFLDPRLGKLQVCQSEPTGVVVYVLNKYGSVIGKRSYYGAACKVKVPHDVLYYNSPFYFITNITIFSMPEVLIEANNVFNYLIRQKKRFFILNCGGMRINKKLRELLFYSLQKHQIYPEIVIGNEAELSCLSETSSYKDAISTVFSQSRIVILTRAEKGSIIRFEDEILTIPAYPVNSRRNLNTIGIGDCYLGVWLGALAHIPSNKWELKDIYKAACTASYSAASVMGQSTTQLNEINAERARCFYNQFK